MGQLFALGVIGLLLGLVTQNFAKKRKQPELGQAGLIVCIIASFLGGFMGMYWMLSAIAAVIFMIIIQSQPKQ
jgi:hypothetical protein